MTEPLKPINSKTPKPQPQPVTPQKPKEVNIGGVIFNPNHIDAEKTTTFMENGVKMNSVFTSAGLQIVYPDQTNPDKQPKVTSAGIYEEWYNPNSSNTVIDDIENATIIGSKKSDDIVLCGESSNNTIIVDQKKAFLLSNDSKRDNVQLWTETENNTVVMDENDKLDISHYQTSAKFKGIEIRSNIATVRVEGEGTSEQEVQLQDALGEGGYLIHKHLQKDE